MSVRSRLLFLTGFMGSGKTTVGKRLADRLAVSFVDLDAEIERKAGRTIKEIFAEDGEATFRRLESEMLIRICQQDSCAVVATGGGVVLDPDNRSLMHDSGLMINLQVEYADVAKRLVHDQNRPLLQLQDEAAMRALMASRTAAYADADFIIATSGKTHLQIVGEIQEWLLT